MPCHIQIVYDQRAYGIRGDLPVAKSDHQYISRMPHELPESALKLRPQRFMYGLLIFLKLGTLYRYILSLCLSQIFLPYLIQHRYGGGLDAPVLIHHRLHLDPRHIFSELYRKIRTYLPVHMRPPYITHYMYNKIPRRMHFYVSAGAFHGKSYITLPSILLITSGYPHTLRTGGSHSRDAV